MTTRPDRQMLSDVRLTDSARPQRPWRLGGSPHRRIITPSARKQPKNLIYAPHKHETLETLELVRLTAGGGCATGRTLLCCHRRAAVGDRFYQEIAPKVAMDRAEIVSMEEQVATPGGTYAKCLQITETTPLEKGVSRKYYAPGVGLVKDDEFVLEKVEKPKK